MTHTDFKTSSKLEDKWSPIITNTLRKQFGWKPERSTQEENLRGVDKWFNTKTGKRIGIDYKFMATWPSDVSLETVSNVERETDGWIEYLPEQGHLTDYLCYVYPSTRKFLLVKFKDIQALYLVNKPAWIKKYEDVQSTYNPDDRSDWWYDSKCLFISIDKITEWLPENSWILGDL